MSAANKDHWPADIYEATAEIVMPDRDTMIAELTEHYGGQYGKNVATNLDGTPDDACLEHAYRWFRWHVAHATDHIACKA